MRKHPEFLDRDLVWKESLLAKIRGWIDPKIHQRLAACGEQPVYKECSNCGKTTTLYTKCSLKFCPLCNFWISRKRSILIRRWADRVRQPKHLVLTIRNSHSTLTTGRFRKVMRSFSRLRRARCLKTATGGCVSMEVTNEGRGWHIHLHVLLDVPWLDMPVLSQKWAHLVGQDFAICKVKDVREESYLGEITKYVCKPDQLVSWDTQDIIQFINAVRGVRFFATFGSLFRLGREIRAEIASERDPPHPCDCGCTRFIIATDESFVARQCRKP